MIADGTYTAVVDRIEEGAEERLAVLIVELDEETTDELVVPVDELPEGGQAPDTVLEVTIEPRLTAARVKENETEARAERAQDRFDRLSRRLDDADSDSPGG